MRRGRWLWGLLVLMLLVGAPVLAQTWFPASTSWLAQRLKDMGFQGVQYRAAAVGGLLESGAPGPTVIFSSNDPLAGLEVLAALGKPAQGQVLAVFGPEVELQRGDYLLKVDFSDTLSDGQIALPASGPSIDSFDFLVSKGKSMPSVAVASDMVLALQNRAQTANEFVVVQLDDYRPFPDGNMGVALSLRVFNPSLREEAARALVTLADERLALHGAKLVSWGRRAAPESGQWPKVREALGDAVEVLQEPPLQTPLYMEDFGRPHVPSLTLRVGSTDRATIEALARVLKMVLELEKPG